MTIIFAIIAAIFALGVVVDLQRREQDNKDADAILSLFDRETTPEANNSIGLLDGWRQ